MSVVLISIQVPPGLRLSNTPFGPSTTWRDTAGEGAADSLVVALARHAAALATAHAAEGAAIRVPKLQFSKHLPTQLTRDGHIIDTLVTERYHRHVKAAADPVHNTVSFEASVLAMGARVAWPPTGRVHEL